MGKSKDDIVTRLVARNIRAVRKTRGLTQTHLGEKMGWKYQAMVSQIEGGKVGVGPANLRRLAGILEVPMSLLYAEELPDEYRREAEPAVTEGTGRRKGVANIRSVPVYPADGFDAENPGEAIQEIFLSAPLKGRKGEIIGLKLAKTEEEGGASVRSKVVVLDISNRAVPSESGKEPSSWHAVRIKGEILVRKFRRIDDFIQLLASDQDANPIMIDLRVLTVPVIGKVLLYVYEVAPAA